MNDQAGDDRTGWQVEAERDAARAAARKGRPDVTGMGLRALGAIVLWLMAGGLFLMGMLLPWTTTNCDYEQHAVCDKSTLDLAMAIPTLTAPLAALIGTWGAFSRRPGVAPVAWVSAVTLVLVAGVVTSAITE
ncbi:hypothetical protein [Streptomyces sp. NPDC048636]|uniref:hypothetical protein n=1 Tax=Streptomyces sp. NPDC048636 TaxID=3155762 RepID=UPI00344A63CD